MRISAKIAAVALTLLGVAACGSAKTGTSSTTTPSTSTAPPATTSSTGTQTAATGGPGVQGVYNVSLSGSAENPAGPRAGRGKVTITLIRKQQLVCWSFSNLAGFDLPPTAADILVGAKGKTGPIFVPLSVKFLPRACIRQSKAQLAAIAKMPSSYYVNVYSKKHPKGAVRAQL